MKKEIKKYNFSRSALVIATPPTASTPITRFNLSFIHSLPPSSHSFIHSFSPSLLSFPSFFPLLMWWHRNPSRAFYQAFQSGSRLRDTKTPSDRYGTGLDRRGPLGRLCVCALSVWKWRALLFWIHLHGWTLGEHKDWQPGSFG